MAFDPDKYLSEKQAAVPARAFDPDAYLNAKTGVATAPELPSTDGPVTKFGKDAFDYSMRALDYAGGASRTATAGLAGGVNYLAGGQQPVTKDDLLRTLQGKAPRSSEYMDKFGVPEGNIHTPLGNISARGVGGFVGDVLLDPLTYLTGGLSAGAKEAALSKVESGLAHGGEMSTAGQIAHAPNLPVPVNGPAPQAAGLPATIAADSITPPAADAASKNASLLSDLWNRAQKYSRPLSNKVEAAGDAVYESAYKVPDAKLAKKGLDPIGPIMRNNGRPQGASATLQTAIDDLMTEKVADRQGWYDAVHQAGGDVDMLEAMKPAVRRAQELRRIDPNAGPQIDQMGQWLKNYTQEGTKVPVSLASDWKTRLYNSSLPPNAFNPMTGRALPIAADIQKTFASGLKTAIEDGANRAIPNSGNEISSLNRELGPLIESSRKIIPTEVLKDATKNAFTSVDALVLGDVLEHPGRVGMFALKKAADLYNTPLGRTYTGNALSNIGRTGAPDILTRRALIDYNNPWENQK